MRPCHQVLGTALLAATAGCFGPDIGPLQQEERRFDSPTATAAEVVLDMTCGELEVRGGAEGLARAEFEFNVAEWRPESRYEEIGGRGRLEIEQPGGRDSKPGVRNRWEVALGTAAPLELRVNLGAGEARLKLGGLPLHKLSVDAGTGSTLVDLTGEWRNDLSAHIDGGIGELVVRVPRTLRVQVDADCGIGDLELRGFRKAGGLYVHEPERAEHTLELNADLGIGELRIELAD